MKCPFCASDDSKVVDSRVGGDGYSIRRRRECIDCTNRFTTYERVQPAEFLVVKSDGRREEFNRDKIISGMRKACEKRPVSSKTIDQFVDDLEKELQEKGEKEIDSREIGGRIVSKLREIDQVAYVRFASVYEEFEKVEDFMDELSKLLKDKEKK